MQSRRIVSATTWIISFGVLAAIVFAYRTLIHANATTVALTLLLYILLLAARLSLRHAIAVSLAATACWNFYFLPPIGNFTVADPENWVALFAFLATSVLGSRLSQQARDEAQHARVREREIELLFSLSRELLQTENVAQVISDLPTMVYRTTGTSSVALFLLEGDRLYQAGLRLPPGTDRQHLRRLALTISDVEDVSNALIYIPLREGVRQRGLLTLSDLYLSVESYRAIGGLVSIALDRAQALEDVARAEANRESERMRTLILDSITHELRTPLTAIKGAASALLNMDQVSTNDRRELLSVVDEEADRLNRLVGRAVEMAQLESNEVHMKIKAIALRDLLDEAKVVCAWVFAAHPVTITLPILPDVLADPVMVQKVLCNLLENAAKYSQPESPIFVSAEQQGAMVLTSIADRGTGIDPDEQGFIFDRLYRARNPGQNIPGTGMGLAISRAIIESHAGRITVESQLGRGSVFTFSLPRASTHSES